MDSVGPESWILSVVTTCHCHCHCLCHCNCRGIEGPTWIRSQTRFLIGRGSLLSLSLLSLVLSLSSLPPSASSRHPDRTPSPEFSLSNRCLRISTPPPHFQSGPVPPPEVTLTYTYHHLTYRPSYPSSSLPLLRGALNHHGQPTSSPRPVPFKSPALNLNHPQHPRRSPTAVPTAVPEPAAAAHQPTKPTPTQRHHATTAVAITGLSAPDNRRRRPDCDSTVPERLQSRC